MKKYLFLFTVTPVQSFISQARKTRDMFSGSKLLTELIDNSMSLLPQEAKVIFPNENLESKPNRFVVELEVENKEKIKELGDELSENIKKMFLEIGNDRFTKNISENKPENFDEQLYNFLSPFWAAVDLEDKDYSTAYKELESTLGATKNIRKFTQSEEIGARKCSVCGEHNALFYGGNKKLAYYQTDAVLGVKDLLQNEGLCAICFTKRFFTTAKYPSTANIATMDKIEKLKDDDRYKDYKNLFNGSYDHQLLFEENLSEKYFYKNKIHANIINAQKGFHKIQELLKENNLSNFSKYYALIMFDGDSMGKWLSGVNLKKDVELKKFHKSLTSAIGIFAKRAKEILIEPKGKVIFAGGEDFMGFVNLYYLFDIVEELLREYDLIINKSLVEFKKEDLNLTFSAGIVITHYKLPLTETINWARKLEKNAKDISDDKNAFSLAVLKHSGEIHQTTFKWGDNDNIAINFNTIGYLAKKLSNGVFSNTFITNLRKEFGVLLDDNNDKDKLLPIISAELKRLLKKSFMFVRTTESDSEYSKIKNEEINELQKRLINLLGSTGKDFDRFFYALEIADFIHRKLNGGE